MISLGIQAWEAFEDEVKVLRPCLLIDKSPQITCRYISINRHINLLYVFLKKKPFKFLVILQLFCYARFVLFFILRNPMIGLAKKQRRARLANPQKTGSPWTGNREIKKKRTRKNCLRYELLHRC